MGSPPCSSRTSSIYIIIIKKPASRIDTFSGPNAYIWLDIIDPRTSFVFKDIDIGENDATEDNTRSSIKTSIKRASSFFQGKNTVENKNKSPEDDNTILARRKEYTPNQELENVTSEKIPLESTISKALGDSVIHSNTSKPGGPDGSSFVESFRHSKW